VRRRRARRGVGTLEPLAQWRAMVAYVSTVRTLSVPPNSRSTHVSPLISPFCPLERLPAFLEETPCEGD